MPATTLQPPKPLLEEAPFQQTCYVSTPNHIASLWGRFFYIYTGKGQLERTNKKLTFTYQSGQAIEIDLSSIESIDRGRYSWWAKPTGLDYMAVNYHEGKRLQTICFTPTISPFTSTWETNRIVGMWIEAVESARQKLAGCAEVRSASS